MSAYLCIIEERLYTSIENDAFLYEVLFENHSCLVLKKDKFCKSR